MTLHSAKRGLHTKWDAELLLGISSHEMEESSQMLRKTVLCNVTAGNLSRGSRRRDFRSMNVFDFHDVFALLAIRLEL